MWWKRLLCSVEMTLAQLLVYDYLYRLVGIRFTLLQVHANLFKVCAAH